MQDQEIRVQDNIPLSCIMDNAEHATPHFGDQQQDKTRSTIHNQGIRPCKTRPDQQPTNTMQSTASQHSIYTARAPRSSRPPMAPQLQHAIQITVPSQTSNQCNPPLTPPNNPPFLIQPSSDPPPTPLQPQSDPPPTLPGSALRGVPTPLPEL